MQPLPGNSTTPIIAETPPVTYPNFFPLKHQQQQPQWYVYPQRHDEGVPVLVHILWISTITVIVVSVVTVISVYLRNKMINKYGETNDDHSIEEEIYIMPQQHLKYHQHHYHLHQNFPYSY